MLFFFLNKDLFKKKNRFYLFPVTYEALAVVVFLWLVSNVLDSAHELFDYVIPNL